VRIGVPVFRGTLVFSLATLALCACAGDGQHPLAIASPTIPVAVSPQPCPVTVPTGSTPPGVQGSGVNYGNGRLWVALWPNGRITATKDYVLPDGSIGEKFGWWRGVRGRLTITGRRLDAQAPAVRSDIPSGYGDEFFQASGITFPTEGCWEITGGVGGAGLTFVTEVVRI
jgi:hypothetical protein